MAASTPAWQAVRARPFSAPTGYLLISSPFHSRTMRILPAHAAHTAHTTRLSPRSKHGSLRRSHGAHNPPASPRLQPFLCDTSSCIVDCTLSMHRPRRIFSSFAKLCPLCIIVTWRQAPAYRPQAGASGFGGCFISPALQTVALNGGCCKGSKRVTLRRALKLERSKHSPVANFTPPHSY